MIILFWFLLCNNYQLISYSFKLMYVMIWIFRNIEALDNQIKYCEETNEDDHTKEVVDELDFLCIHNHLFYYALQR